MRLTVTLRRHRCGRPEGLEVVDWCVRGADLRVRKWEELQTSFVSLSQSSLRRRASEPSEVPELHHRPLEAARSGKGSDWK